jgi:protein TonB
MKRKINLRSLTLCVSLALHGAIFFLVSIYPANNFPSLPNHSTDPFALVNLAVIEPAAPLPPPSPPKPSPPPPPVLPEELPEDSADTEPAETFIAMEKPLPENANPSPPVENPAADPGASAEKADAALTKAYMKRNYNYIMSSIQKNLHYPSQARRTGAQGTAEISFTIHEDGRVSDITISRSSGSELLDTAAVEAIHAASPFRPPPAEARLAIPVAFRLR